MKLIFCTALFLHCQFAMTQTKQSEKQGSLGFLYSLNTSNPDSIRLKVGYVFAGSPAEKAELSAGNLINAIDGQRLGKLNFDDIKNMLAGKPETNVSLSVQRGIFAGNACLTLTRKYITDYAEIDYFKKGNDAFVKGNYESAVQNFKLAGKYPYAVQFLSNIYAGIAPGPDAKDPDFYKKRERLLKLVNPDAAKALTNSLLTIGFPSAALYLYGNCRLMNGSAFYKNFAKFGTDNKYGLSNYWLYEAAKNDNLTAQEMLIENITNAQSNTGFSHDKNEALYWYKRAAANGTTKADAILAAIKSMPSIDYHFIKVQDIVAMTKIAHQYKEDQFNYSGIGQICPFGIRGFYGGYYDDFGFDEGLKLNWYSYYIQNESDATQIFNNATRDMQQQFSNVQYPGASWYSFGEYLHQKTEHSILVKLNTTEVDGKKYDMQLGLCLLKSGNLGYYLVLFYNQRQ